MSSVFSKGVGFILKNVMTETVMKTVVGVLGDYLVGSYKNKLDDMESCLEFKKNCEISKKNIYITKATGGI